MGLVSRMGRVTRSGQIFVVSGMLIALIILSTGLYVYELEVSTMEPSPCSAVDLVLMVQLGTRHVVIGSLANVSRGGANETLVENLEKWGDLVENYSYQLGRCIQTFSAAETPPYTSGIWLSWGTNGAGFSVASSNFTLRWSDRETDLELNYTLTVNTTLLIEGTYRNTGGDGKDVNVTAHLFNEEKPALLESISIYYLASGEWLATGSSNNQTVTDYGNGTYLISFSADIPDETVEVSAHVYDQRGVYVRANTTCTELP